MNIARILIAIFILLISTQAICQESSPTLPILKTLCIEEKATGFNWKSGDWVHATFKPSRKWLIQKIKILDNRQNEMDLQKYGNCTKETKVILSETMKGSRSCYSVREFGMASTPLFDNEMCWEYFENNTLKAIYCKNIIFKPDGNFIMNPHGPTANIIESNPKDDYKDSLVLSVGKCSKLEE